MKHLKSARLGFIAYAVLPFALTLGRTAIAVEIDAADDHRPHSTLLSLINSAETAATADIMSAPPVALIAIGSMLAVPPAAIRFLAIGVGLMRGISARAAKPDLTTRVEG